MNWKLAWVGRLDLAAKESVTDAPLVLGIHNERGFKKVSPIPSAKQLVKDLLDTLMDTADPERAYLGFKCGSDGFYQMRP